MNQSTHIQLVTISASENEAAQIESHLRDRGQPVRMQWLQASEDLEQRLAKLWPDMIFCDGDDEKQRDFAIHCCSKVAPEVPILMLTESITAEAVDTALQKRARDAVSTNHLDHLQAVYLRELAAAKLESNLREARAELKALRARMNSLVTVSKLAVANLQDGILIDPSNDFAELFGYESSEALSGHPFLELVQEDERAKIKKVLNRCANGKSTGDEVDTQALMFDGKSFEMHLRIVPVASDESGSLEIQVNPILQSTANMAEVAPMAAAETAAIEETGAPAGPAVSPIDEAESARIAKALANKKQRIVLHPFITLDGQQASCHDALYELQDEDGRWFRVTPATRAQAEVLQLCDGSFFEKVITLLTDQLSKGEISTILLPLLPACLPRQDDLVEMIKEKAKTALDGGQNLVVTFHELQFLNDVTRIKPFAKALHDIGVRIALDQSRGNANSVKLMDALHPDYVCLDRAATQLVISQGSEHPDLSKILQESRDRGMHIVAYPLQDAHSMAMLWQRGVNMVRGSDLQQVAA